MLVLLTGEMVDKITMDLAGKTTLMVPGEEWRERASQLLTVRPNDIEKKKPQA